MGRKISRMCELFNCDRRKGHYCCADCGYRKSGRWVKPAPGDGENYCSVCHADQPWFYGYGYYDSDYCPNCGACMDSKEALEDGSSD